MQNLTRADSTNPVLSSSDDSGSGKGENRSTHRVIPSSTEIKKYIKEYCNTPAIHGVRYLTEDNRNPREKLFWIIALSICLTGCYLMVVKVKEKLDTTPVLVTFAETATNIWHVPFPAVTVCPETKSRQTFLNFTKYSKLLEKGRNTTFVDGDNITTSDLPEDIRKKMEALALVCFLGKINISEIVGAGKLHADEAALKFLYTSTVQLDDPHMDCYWGGGRADGGCLIHLRPVLTEVGVCFSFNMMPDSLVFKQDVVNNKVFAFNQPEVKNDWDPDTGYSLTAGIQSRPWRASGINWKEPGLWLALSEKLEDIDYVCRPGATGYRIIVHSPVEMPSFRSHLVIHVPFERNVVVTLTPMYMTTSPGLESYDPHKRQCYFAHEKHLQHFNYYTQKSCELECVANATLELCGCVPFYMPRNSSTKICGAALYDCTTEAAKNLRDDEIQRDLEQRAAGESRGSLASKCDCLPSCVSLDYKADVTQTKLQWDKTRRAKGIENYPYTDSSVYVVFKDSHFISNRRSELYGQIDFLANCGGILSLFSGFSIVAVIELVYFLTLRIWSNIFGQWKRRRRAVSQSEDRRDNRVSTGKTS